MEKQSDLIPVFRLGDIVPRDVTTAWKVAKGFNKLDRRFVTRVIRAIHDIPRLVPDVTLPELEVYIGRSSFKTIRARFAQHRKRLGHEYGAILFDTPWTIVADAEKAGIALVKELERLESLCVGNLKVHSGGAPGSGKALIYMTWGTASVPASGKVPTTEQLDEISYNVAKRAGWSVEDSEVRTALRSLRTKKPKKALRWLPRYQRR